MQSAKKLIDNDLERFIAKWRQSYDLGSIDAIDAFCQIILRGGKRLRGILAMQSYYAHGGIDETVALGAARVLELVQAYLLVIDDVADRSDTRRGGPSAHRIIESSAQTAKMHGDLAHYGRAQAINAAQSGIHKAALELLQLNVSDKAARRALTSLHKNLEITGVGQMNDLFNESTNEQLDEAAVERVLTQKSAYYTFINPLELGACLAGRDALDSNLHSYSLHTGCAFQITDDIIGTFGAEAATGKNTNDDIREGKMTLISQFTLAHADDNDRLLLQSIIGNANASDTSCDMVRDVMISSGAREYASQRRDWHADQAHTALSMQSTLDPKFISFLDQLIDYVSTRQS